MEDYSLHHSTLAAVHLPLTLVENSHATHEYIYVFIYYLIDEDIKSGIVAFYAGNTGLQVTSFTISVDGSWPIERKMKGEMKGKKAEAVPGWMKMLECVMRPPRRESSRQHDVR